MSIRTRLILGAVCVALPFVALAIGLSLAVQGRMGVLQETAKAVSDNTHWVAHLQRDALKAAMALEDAVESGDPGDRDRFAVLDRGLNRTFDQALAGPLARTEAGQLVRAARDQWQEAQVSAQRLLSGSLSPGSAAREAERRRFRASLDQALAYLEQADDLVRQEVDRQSQRVREMQRDVALGMALGLGLGVLTLLGVAGYLNRSLLRPLRGLEEAARRLGEGDFSSRAPAGAADEIGQLAATFNAMAEKIERELEARQRLERQLRDLADRDPLTGLYNRRRFEEEAGAYLLRAAGSSASAAVLFVDLDKFKEVNDTRGHRAGDEVLAAVGRRIGAGVRASDIPARLGGDEFAVFLPGAGAAEALAVARRLLESLGQCRVRVGGQDTGLTASIGIALYPEHGTTVAELLAHADEAMYQSKGGGKHLCVYTPGRDAADGQPR